MRPSAPVFKAAAKTGWSAPSAWLTQLVHPSTPTLACSAQRALCYHVNSAFRPNTAEILVDWKLQYRTHQYFSTSPIKSIRNASVSRENPQESKFRIDGSVKKEGTNKCAKTVAYKPFAECIRPIRRKSSNPMCSPKFKPPPSPKPQRVLPKRVVKAVKRPPKRPSGVLVDNLPPAFPPPLTPRQGQNDVRVTKSEPALSRASRPGRGQTARNTKEGSILNLNSLIRKTGENKSLLKDSGTTQSGKYLEANNNYSSQLSNTPRSSPIKLSGAINTARRMDVRKNNLPKMTKTKQIYSPKQETNQSNPPKRETKLTYTPKGGSGTGFSVSTSKPKGFTKSSGACLPPKSRCICDKKPPPIPQSVPICPKKASKRPVKLVNVGVSMPGCKPRVRQDCSLVMAAPGMCTRIEPPSPSFSECIRELPLPLPWTECRNLGNSSHIQPSVPKLRVFKTYVPIPKV